MSNGLDDVIAAETALSDVDGLAGQLIIRGRALEELVGKVRYEEVLGLLLSGLFDAVDASALPAALGRARQQIFARARGDLPPDLPVVDAVRVLIAGLEDGDDLADALALVAAPAVFAPAVIRHRRGEAPIAPDASLGHAADILRMLHGRSPSEEETAALDAYLVTVCDHGLNASTFAARVVASTHAGLTSSVLAALSALKGPLHGGAPGPVLDMFDAIERPEAAEAWLNEALERGERVMGFGHRVYRVRDPRADALREAGERLVRRAGDSGGRYALAGAIEMAALKALADRKPGRPLKTNVEFYTALLLEALGFPRESFTLVFAMGRVGGWIAHAREQALFGRLLRPQSKYIGPRPDRAA
ncbi:MAG TPA: citrate synthase/methylcitrate synthase [Roseiarcus sp.]|nr:citrate synthase/methylcitrate synthase [Roseiarcus sp.]